MAFHRLYRALGSGFVGIGVLLGCQTQPPAPPVPVPIQPVVSVIPRGTPIPLVLVTELESGNSPVGTSCRFLIESPVTGPNNVVFFEKGSMVAATVVRSRRENSLGGLMNQPARLDVHLLSASDVQGKPVDLSAQPDTISDINFDRSNTGRPGAENLNENPNAEELKRLLLGNAPLDKAGKDRLQALVSQLRLSSASRNMQQGDGDRIMALIQKVRGASLSSSSGLTGSSVPVEAAVELLGVVQEVGSKVGRMIQGRNIRAYVGTKVTAYTTAEQRLTVYRR